MRDTRHVTAAPFTASRRSEAGVPVARRNRRLESCTSRSQPALTWPPTIRGPALRGHLPYGVAGPSTIRAVAAVAGHPMRERGTHTNTTRWRRIGVPLAGASGWFGKLPAHREGAACPFGGVA